MSFPKVKLANSKNMANILSQVQDGQVDPNYVRQRNPQILNSNNVQYLFKQQLYPSQPQAQNQQQQNQQQQPIRPIIKPRTTPIVGNTQQQQLSQDTTLPPQNKYSDNDIDNTAIYSQDEQNQKYFEIENSIKKNLSFNQNLEKIKTLNEISELDNREKWNQQERVMTYLLEQVNNLEKSMQSDTRRNKNQLDIERENRNKLEGNLRFLQDQIEHIQNESTTKIELLVNKLQKEERSKQALEQKIIANESNQKEILFFIRNQQSIETNEMQQMRGMIQEKITEETQFSIKEKEKSKALFLEVVRLGENFQQTNEQITEINQVLQNRINQLEQKLYENEKQFGNIAVKGESGLGYVTDWNDKLDKRIQSLESNIFNISKELVRDKDNHANQINVNTRLQDDIRNIIGNLQKDYQSRLDTRVTELVNRIVMEHEERMRQAEDLKNNFDLREKINSEKVNYEKEEMRERYQGLDSLVRIEFQRKDEALKSLQSLCENQIKQLQQVVKSEENARHQQEIIFRNEIIKLQEYHSQEYELFKGQQSSIIEKITEMMKIEIQTRLSTNVDLKNLTQAIAGDIVQDINNLKDNIDSQNKRFLKDLKEISSECSHRSQQLSRYIDDENVKTVDVLTKKYEKLKIIFTKLAEQFRNHLLNTDQNRKDVENRTLMLERKQEDIKTEMYKLIADTQQAFENHLKQEIDNMEFLINNKITSLEDKCIKIDQELNKDDEIWQQTVENNRVLLTAKINQFINYQDNINKIQDQNIDSCLEQSGEAMQQLEKLQENLISLQKSQKEQIRNIDESLNTQINKLDDKVEQFMEDQNKQMDDFDNYQSQNYKDIESKFRQLLENGQKSDEQGIIKFQQVEGDIAQVIELINQASQNIEFSQNISQDEIIAFKSKYILDHYQQEFNQLANKEFLNTLIDIQKDMDKEFQQGREQNVQEFSKLSEDIKLIKKRVHEDLAQEYDRKIQHLLENLKEQQGDSWNRLIDKQLNNEIENKDNQYLNQLNEILVTQDVYSKAKIK